MEIFILVLIIVRQQYILSTAVMIKEWGWYPQGTECNSQSQR